VWDWDLDWDWGWDLGLRRGWVCYSDLLTTCGLLATLLRPWGECMKDTYLSDIDIRLYLFNELC
jgi:hypothetical protein